MNVELPPHIIVRQLLRQQTTRKREFTSWLSAAFDAEWATDRPKGDALIRFVTGYQNQLSSAGNFAESEIGSADRLKLRSASEYRTRSYILWPITLGQFLEVDAAYTEQGLMLTQVGGHFTPTKAMIYDGPTFFVWTEHALRRFCERDPAGQDIATVLTDAGLQLARSTALAVALRITKGETEENFNQTCWLPFNDGLVVLTKRSVTAHRSTQQLGWKFNLAKKSFSNIFVKPASINPVMVRSDQGEHRNQDLISVTSWFVTTYIGLHQLSPLQRAYRDTFENFEAAVGESAKDRLFKLGFDPFYSQPGIEIPDEQIEGRPTVLWQEAARLLQNVSFVAHARQPVMQILDGELSSAAYRRLIERRRSAT